MVASQASFSKFFDKMRTGFCFNAEKHFLLEVYFNCKRDFQNSLPFTRSAYFYVAITGGFERLQRFKFEISFLKKRKPLLKNWSTVFWLEVLPLKEQHEHKMDQSQIPQFCE